MATMASPIAASRSVLPNEVDADTFYRAITSAQNYRKEEEKQNGVFNTVHSEWFGAYVHVYSVEEYQDMRRILFDSGRAGFALKNRDIVSVFKHHASTISALKTMMPVAVALGGNRLDCFGGELPFRYLKLGFFPVAKVRFNPRYAPEDWNYARDGEPDIIYMVYKKAIVDQQPAPSQELDSQMESAISRLNYTTYEDALAIQMQSCMIESDQVL